MYLYQDYRQKVLPKVKEKLGLTNINEVPTITKVVVNIGMGSYITKKDKDYEPLVERVKMITGQTPVVVNSRIAVSNFKLRKDQPNGIRVTLRGKHMLQFLDRLINIALPRTRDFRGISRRAFDKQGNYSLGVKEVTIFPEVVLDDISKMHGLQINISTTAKDIASSRILLEEIGMPFAK